MVTDRTEQAPRRSGAGLSAGFRRFVRAPRLISRMVQLAGLMMAATGAFGRQVMEENGGVPPEGCDPGRAYFLLQRAVRWAAALRARLRAQRRAAIWEMPGALVAMAGFDRGPERERDDAEALAAVLARAARRRERGSGRAAREAAAAAQAEIAGLSDQEVARQIGADIAEVAVMIRQDAAGQRIRAIAEQTAEMLAEAKPVTLAALSARWPEVMPVPKWRTARAGAGGRAPP